MMRRVVVLPRAKEQMYAAALWWAEHHSIEQAVRWLAQIESAIGRLENDAERFVCAKESPLLAVELRQMNFDVSTRPTHRILFSVEEDSVMVYAVRHLAQRDLVEEDLR